MPVDNFEIFDLIVSTGGSISYVVDGGAAVMLNQAGSSLLRKTTIRCGSVGTHKLAIKRVTSTRSLSAIAPITARWRRSMRSTSAVGPAKHPMG